MLERIDTVSLSAFLEPIVSFTFLLNAVLLLPLSLITFYGAAGVRGASGGPGGSASPMH
jgi:hypothetical protein